jgi:hypothetical protein
MLKVTIAATLAIAAAQEVGFKINGFEWNGVEWVLAQTNQVAPGAASSSDILSADGNLVLRNGEWVANTMAQTNTRPVAGGPVEGDFWEANNQYQWQNGGYVFVGNQATAPPTTARPTSAPLAPPQATPAASPAREECDWVCTPTPTGIGLVQPTPTLGGLVQLTPTLGGSGTVSLGSAPTLNLGGTGSSGTVILPSVQMPSGSINLNNPGSSLLAISNVADPSAVPLLSVGTVGLTTIVPVDDNAITVGSSNNKITVNEDPGNTVRISGPVRVYEDSVVFG